MKVTRLPSKLQDWVDARKRHHLSHATVQMARELGLNPKKLGQIDNHRQEPWKVPLPVFIENLYEKRFSKKCPDQVQSIEQLFHAKQRKKEAKKLIKPTDNTNVRMTSTQMSEAKCE